MRFKQDNYIVELRMRFRMIFFLNQLLCTVSNIGILNQVGIVQKFFWCNIIICWSSCVKEIDFKIILFMTFFVIIEVLKLVKRSLLSMTYTTIHNVILLNSEKNDISGHLHRNVTNLSSVNLRKCSFASQIILY